MANPTARVYLRCLSWGVATGSVTGAVTGTGIGVIAGLNGEMDPGLALLSVVAGAVIGALLAVLPSVVGGLAVTALLRQRHPWPGSPDAVRRTLCMAFCVLVGVLDAMVLLGVLAADGLSTVAGSLPWLLLADACVALMLWRARKSITRAWSDA